uniref:Uncharacterized protein n=1 Tax=Arundo donax TaxID=35708 RepID=A0A0A9A9G2_ARUDO
MSCSPKCWLWFLIIGPVNPVPCGFT